MPSFFAFQQGSERRTRPSQETEPLLGRFRAVPGVQRVRERGDSVGRLIGGYNSLFGHIGSSLRGENDADGASEAEGGGPEGEGTRSERHGIRKDILDLWVRPQQGAVGRCLITWWSRWLILVVLPASVAVAWCAIPFPQYPLPDDYNSSIFKGDRAHKIPGRGQARVMVNFWFFLFVYYGFYNLMALMWVTKVFNIYSLNWWPESLGFPITFCTIAVVSICAPIPAYYVATIEPLLSHTTTWIIWTFVTMAMPVVVACGILMSSDRHLGLRQSLSETQRIFTQNWWTGETDDTVARRDRRRAALSADAFDPSPHASSRPDLQARPAGREAFWLRKLWIPASFMRFMWFCLALFIALSAYVLGEAYAEVYLRTLPHTNVETVVYVYSWVATIHLLDGLTGWILGGGEGERVGSYPLGWVFKLYFSLTYQTYVRALYARLRSPQTFIILQLLSSAGLILLHPFTMSNGFYCFLNICNLNNQGYSLYKKYCGRSIFIRSLAENVSMLSFLGQVAVLHFGSNREVYPYFAFDDTDPSSGGGSDDGGWFPGVPGYGDGHSPLPVAGTVYDFKLTFWASIITWVCELTAAWIVRQIVKRLYKFDVDVEGRNDIGAWPELLPTGCILMVHVLQNMIFGIVRLEFP